jgi:hypothetical protein
MRLLALLVCLFVMSAATARAEEPPVAGAPPALHDDPRPRSGVGGIVVGAVGLGQGTLALATIPICFASFYPNEAQPFCVGSSVLFGVGGYAVGAVGLSLGLKRRARYKAWRQRELERRGVALDGFSGGYHAGQATLLLRLRF